MGCLGYEVGRTPPWIPTAGPDSQQLLLLAGHLGVLCASRPPCLSRGLPYQHRLRVLVPCIYSRSAYVRGPSAGRFPFCFISCVGSL